MNRFGISISAMRINLFTMAVFIWFTPDVALGEKLVGCYRKAADTYPASAQGPCSQFLVLRLS